MFEKVKDGSFAEACFNENSTDELIDALLSQKPDKTDLKTWKITPKESRESIAEALRAKINVLKDNQCNQCSRR